MCRCSTFKHARCSLRNKVCRKAGTCPATNPKTLVLLGCRFLAGQLTVLLSIPVKMIRGC